MNYRLLVCYTSPNSYKVLERNCLGPFCLIFLCICGCWKWSGLYSARHRNMSLSFPYGHNRISKLLIKRDPSMVWHHNILGFSICLVSRIVSVILCKCYPSLQCFKKLKYSCTNNTFNGCVFMF